MRNLVLRYLDKNISRRDFFDGMGRMGFSAAAAEAVLKPLEASESAEASPEATTGGGSPVVGTGGDLIAAQVKAAGAEYFFSNPGSLEVGLFDAFTDLPGIQHIMGLHEGIVISMADGYNKTSGKPAFVNVHAIVGSAQAAGQMYNASRDGSAIVVTAGLSDPEVWTDDVSLGARPGFNQKEVNRQFTKISWEARHAESLALMVRRAFKVAATEPGGPVYLALAPSALTAKNVSAQILPAERFMIRGRVRPETRGRRRGGSHDGGRQTPDDGGRRRGLAVGSTGRGGGAFRETRLARPRPGLSMPSTVSRRSIRITRRRWSEPDPATPTRTPST